MRIVSVNVATAVPVQIDGRSVATAITKRRVDGAVAIRPLGLAGDEQADLTVHGGIDKAVYAYSSAHYAFWQTVRAQARAATVATSLPAGSMGENLTVDDLDEAALWIGDRLALPGCLLAVSAPRFPCFKFAAAMGFPQAPKLMVQSGYCGAYLTVLEPGQVRAGDEVSLHQGPREVNLRELFKARMRGR
jgi:MOSC domain-containing protein YiiM